MLKIVIIGAGGRMGLALVRCGLRTPNVQVVGAVEAQGSPFFGQDIGAMVGEPATGVTLTSNLAAVAGLADVLIDFSSHTAVPGTVGVAVALKKATVIGTTGLNERERAVLQKAARLIPVLCSPNMSVGVNLLFALVKKAAATLGVAYDAEIVEVHHRFKKDAPSGTALRLGERIAEGRGQNFKAVAVFGREGETGERSQGQIGIHAVRAGDTVGDHSVIFATEGERVELAHKATSREALAVGALRAAAWVVAREPGLYDMQDVLGLC